MSKYLPAAAAVVLLALSFFAHSKIIGDGRGNERLEEFTINLDGVPAEFGDWTSVDQPLDPQEFERTHCTNYISRVYQNKKTGEEVSVYLVSGSARHITIHSPDWCYQGAGYRMQDEPEPFTVHYSDGKDATFSAAVFRKETLAGEENRMILWSYADEPQWDAPRLAGLAKARFAGRPALYKVYLITVPASVAAPFEESPSVGFAQEFLPILNDILFATGDEVVRPPADQVAAEQ
ncbi:MAG: exosortase-associated EpsI family protein [Planctomycetales bacterium]|nr:exosortase-associated EpsI family protein [Planctomycetales bacterium]